MKNISIQNANWTASSFFLAVTEERHCEARSNPDFDFKIEIKCK
jgi:hypothetical protein